MGAARKAARFRALFIEGSAGMMVKGLEGSYVVGRRRRVEGVAAPDGWQARGRSVGGGRRARPKRRCCGDEGFLDARGGRKT